MIRQTLEGLHVPTDLIPQAGRHLPSFDYDTLRHLTEAGWHRVGLVVPMITRTAKLLILEHNEIVQESTGRVKVREGMFGPLSETSRGVGPVIEQPIETLYRGLEEETGMHHTPESLKLRHRAEGGWFNYRWPVGVEFPDEYAFALCSPVYVPPEAEAKLLSYEHGNDEIRGLQVMSPEDIKDTHPDKLRPGVLGWLAMLEDTDFLRWPERSHQINFEPAFASSMRDIELQQGA